MISVFYRGYQEFTFYQVQLFYCFNQDYDGCRQRLVSFPDPPSGGCGEREREKEGLGDNPGRKCPGGRNSATGVDYESWPQVQCAKPLTWKRA